MAHALGHDEALAGLQIDRAVLHVDEEPAGDDEKELVFVVGTTNFVESLDPALLRPGRFEFHLYIPYPENDDRREIIKIYDKKMRLQMGEEGLEYAVRRTGRGYETPTGTPFSGDHLNALCRAVARIRLREDRGDETRPEDVDRAFTEFEEKLDLTPREERLLATHEAGHAVVSLYCPMHPPIERITIKSETTWAPAYVRYSQDDSRRLGLTRNQLMEDLCVLLGGIEAERLLLEDVTLLRRENISVHIRFRGGMTQALILPLPQSAAQLRKTKPAVIAEIDRLMNTNTETEIAALLNERGFRSGESHPFTRSIVVRRSAQARPKPLQNVFRLNRSPKRGKRATLIRVRRTTHTAAPATPASSTSS